jgi:hypothetical protein
MSLHSLTSGTLAPFLQEWTTLHQRQSRWKLAPDSPTNGGDHLCTSSDNDLCSERLASSSDHLRVSATANRSSPPSSYEGVTARPLKPKNRGGPVAGGTDGLASRGNHLCNGQPHHRKRPHHPTSGSDHLCTDGQRLHQCARRGLRSRPRYGSEDKTIQERRLHPHGVRRVVRPLGATGGTGEAVDVANPRTTRPSPMRWTGSHAPPQRQEAAPEAAPEQPRPGS